MNRCISTFLICFLIVRVLAQVPPAPGSATYVRDTLECEWMFTASGTSNWKPATVPGCVHTDLLANRLIADPMMGLNEKECEWVGETNWTYQSSQFDLPEEVLGKKVILLRFNGLDTYADVFLNEELILQADNAFRSWEVNVIPYLKRKGNQLTIRFRSPLKEAERRRKNWPYPIPGVEERAVVRKPQYQYGWDWGPRLITCGITAPVEWMAWDGARFEDIYIRQDRITEKEATLTAVFEINVERNDPCSLFFHIPHTGDSFSTPLVVRKGLNLVELPFTLEYPRLWWCNDQGDPWLYEFHAWMTCGKEVFDHRVVRTGVRSLELVNERDSIGESFYFELNGAPVFAKGANMIPMTFFPGEAKREDYRQLLEKCRDSHFNMIRVWGGGVYEDEAFYELCDEMGIMVWQDFMFACSTYPADSLFITNVIAEATEQTRRLRNHPCIALWCGNNEVSEGWEHWGWQAGLNDKDRMRVRRAYEDLFLLTLEPIVEKNTRTDYWISSPRYGRYDKRSLTEGDCHYWGLWHDEEPFELMLEKIPRFMSEFGMQSFPSEEVLRMMCDGQKPSLDHPGVAAHQKHPKGFELMRKYMLRWYPGADDSDLKRYAQITQAVQAEGMCMAIEAHRRSAPRCMGSLFWQLNDVWPAFSWSSLDVEGKEKLFFSMLKDVFAPQLISYTVQDGQLSVYFINDLVMADVQYYDMYLAIRSFDGKELHAVALTDFRLGNGVTELFREDLRSLIGTDDPRDKVIVVELRDRDAITRHSRYGKLVPASGRLFVPVWSAGSAFPELLVRP